MSDLMRLCTLCRHFEFDSNSGSSCPTCGDDGSLSFGCSLNHWDELGLGSDRKDFYRGIRHGLTCKDFDALTPEEIAAL